jgi:hypothetical protein
MARSWTDGSAMSRTSELLKIPRLVRSYSAMVETLVFMVLTCNGNDDVQCAAHQAFHVIGFAVHDQKVDQDNADEQGDGLVSVLA